jgi:TPM domain
MKDFKDNVEKENFYQVEKEEISKPHPIADHTYFVFDDLKKGQARHGHFILRNVGGDYKDFEIVAVEADPVSADTEPFLKIVDTSVLAEGQDNKMPMKICFEVKARDWSKYYSGTIIIRLDDQEEKITVNLNTQTKPVNDFAGIFKPQEIKKITRLVRKLEKTTSAEISVASVDSLEGKDIEKYSNELFNEWGIGKEDKHNGILFLINKDESKFRIEVGLGLEKLITADFINSLFEKYIIPNFRAGKFGAGVYQTLGWIASRIILDFRKQAKIQ